MLLIPFVALVAACNTVAPVQGTGFNTPEYQAQREAQLAGQGIAGNPLLAPVDVSQQPLGAPGTAVATGENADIANQARRRWPARRGKRRYLRPATPQFPTNRTLPRSPSRRSIESDAARIEQNRQTYELVAPTAVPERGADGQPNIVQYALSTSNPVGTQLYSRAGFNLQAKAQRNCARFPSADQAQIEFLSNGGPQRDRKGLDPDGDGYACGWDPSPFRSAVSN